MAAAVRLLSDESILVTYNLYCQKDDVVTILVRGINEPSPTLLALQAIKTLFASEERFLVARLFQRSSFSQRLDMHLA